MLVFGSLTSAKVLTSYSSNPAAARCLVVSRLALNDRPTVVVLDLTFRNLSSPKSTKAERSIDVSITSYIPP